MRLQTGGRPSLPIPDSVHTASFCFFSGFRFSLWKLIGFFLCTQFLEMASGCMPADNTAGCLQALGKTSAHLDTHHLHSGKCSLLTCFPPCPPFFLALLLSEWRSRPSRPLFCYAPVFQLCLPPTSWNSPLASVTLLLSVSFCLLILIPQSSFLFSIILF